MQRRDNQDPEIVLNHRDPLHAHTIFNELVLAINRLSNKELSSHSRLYQSDKIINVEPAFTGVLFAFLQGIDPCLVNNPQSDQV